VLGEVKNLSNRPRARAHRLRRSVTPPKHTLKSAAPVDKLHAEISSLKQQNKELEDYRELMEQYNDIKPIGLDSSLLSDGANTYADQLEQLRQNLVDRDAVVQELNGANHRLQNMQARLKTEGTRSEKLSKTISSLYSHISEKDTRIEKLELDVAERNTKIQDFAKKYNALNKLKATAIEQLEKTERENKEKTHQLSKLQGQVEDKAKRLQTLDRKCKEMGKKQTAHAKELEKAKAGKSALTGNLKAKKLECIAKGKQCKRLEGDIRDLNEQLLTYKIQAQSSEKLLARDKMACAEVESLQQQLAEYRRQTDRLQEQLEIAQTYRGQITPSMPSEQQEAYEAQIEKLNAELETLRHEQDDEQRLSTETEHALVDQVEGYKQEINKLWDELSEAQAVSLKPREPEVEAEDVQFLYFSISEVQGQLDAALAKLNSAEKALGVAKEQARSVEGERDSMQTTIIKIREEHERNEQRLRRQLQALKDGGKHKAKCLFF